MKESLVLFFKFCTGYFTRGKVYLVGISHGLACYFQSLEGFVLLGFGFLVGHDFDGKTRVF